MNTNRHSSKQPPSLPGADSRSTRPRAAGCKGNVLALVAAAFTTLAGVLPSVAKDRDPRGPLPCVDQPSGMFRGGSGTATDPYQIGTVQQLQAIRNDLGAHYVLLNDIDASESATWDGGRGFCPIGDPAHPFQGTFDGQGHAIDGLKIDRFGHITTHIALFGITGDRSAVRNVSVRKAFVKGCDCVGILAGVNQGTISHCHVSGEVFGSGTFGGLVGGNSKGRISHCSAAVNVAPVWIGNHLGGLVGSNNDGEISDCFATGAVTGMENPGGLAGVNNAGVIRRCYASGNVASSFGGASDAYRRGAGGLVAQNQCGGTIIDSFATGKVTGPAGLPVGALLGANMDKGAAKNCFTRAVRDTPLPGVGKNHSDAGLAEIESVVDFGAELFEPGKGPLKSWSATGLWSWEPCPGTVTLPRFTSEFERFPAGGRAAVATAHPAAIVELTDGSRVVGTPAIAALRLVSPLGRIDVPLRSIQQVIFQADRETAVVSLANGDRLSGVVDLATFDLIAEWGNLAIPLHHLRSLTIGNAPRR